MAEGLELPFAPELGPITITRQPDWHFDSEAAARELCAHFKTASLSGFGADGLRPAIAAAGASTGTRTWDGSLYNHMDQESIFTTLHPSSTFFYLNELPRTDS